MQVPKTGSQWLLGSGKTTMHSKPRCSGDEEERKTKERKQLSSLHEKNRLNKLGTVQYRVPLQGVLAYRQEAGRNCESC